MASIYAADQGIYPELDNTNNVPQTENLWFRQVSSVPRYNHGPQQIPMIPVLMQLSTTASELTCTFTKSHTKARSGLCSVLKMLIIQFKRREHHQRGDTRIKIGNPAIGIPISMSIINLGDH